MRNPRLTKGRSASIRSEEHTSELQSPLNISYAVFCLKKKNIHGLDLANRLQRLQDVVEASGRDFHFVFFFNETATTEIYTLSDTLSLHDALPICSSSAAANPEPRSSSTSSA